MLRRRRPVSRRHMTVARVSRSDITVAVVSRAHVSVAVVAAGWADGHAHTGVLRESGSRDNSANAKHHRRHSQVYLRLHGHISCLKEVVTAIRPVGGANNFRSRHHDFSLSRDAYRRTRAKVGTPMREGAVKERFG